MKGIWGFYSLWDLHTFPVHVQSPDNCKISWALRALRAVLLMLPDMVTFPLQISLGKLTLDLSLGGIQTRFLWTTVFWKYRLLAFCFNIAKGVPTENSRLLYTLLISFSDAEKFLILIKSSLSFFLFPCVIWCHILKIAKSHILKCSSWYNSKPWKHTCK